MFAVTVQAGCYHSQPLSCSQKSVGATQKYAYVSVGVFFFEVNTLLQYFVNYDTAIVLNSVLFNQRLKAQ